MLQKGRTKVEWARWRHILYGFNTGPYNSDLTPLTQCASFATGYDLLVSCKFVFTMNRWRLLLMQFICWIITLDHLCVRLQCGLFQGCGAVVKKTQLRLRNYSFQEHVSGSSFGALGFQEYGSGLLFFHGSGSRSCFWSFSHINILIALVCRKLNGKKWIKWKNGKWIK